jgi:hypothetical protein
LWHFGFCWSRHGLLGNNPYKTFLRHGQGRCILVDNRCIRSTRFIQNNSIVNALEQISDWMRNAHTLWLVEKISSMPWLCCDFHTSCMNKSDVKFLCIKIISKPVGLVLAVCLEQLYTIGLGIWHCIMLFDC